MPLFNFSFTPLTEIPLRGKPKASQRQLERYGFSHGTCSIDAGQSRLFQYSPQFLAHADFICPQYGIEGDCVNHSIIRLYEDVIELLPDILQSIPIEAYLLISSLEKQRAWTERLQHLFEIAETPELEDLHHEAIGWFHRRKLSKSPVKGDTNVWFWRFDDQVFIRWDNKASQGDGMPQWTATEGEYSMPTKIFLAEVESFHFRLMKGMSERIQEMRDRNPIPNVNINIDTLIEQHTERKQSLARALAVQPTKVDWARILAANEQLSKLRLD